MLFVITESVILLLFDFIFYSNFELSPAPSTDTIRWFSPISPNLEKYIVNAVVMWKNHTPCPQF